MTEPPLFIIFSNGQRYRERAINRMFRFTRNIFNNGPFCIPVINASDKHKIAAYRVTLSNFI
ncbi:MAG: hypothetical protein ABUT20_44595 [Bacteroidota bacterium]